jgi:DNA-binding GntR family transcriptional regulator
MSRARRGGRCRRKLLRGVFTKGLAATVFESVSAAEFAGCGRWAREQIAAESGSAELVDRLIDGSGQHAARRVHEMRDCRAYLDELGAEVCDRASPGCSGSPRKHPQADRVLGFRPVRTGPPVVRPPVSIGGYKIVGNRYGVGPVTTAKRDAEQPTEQVPVVDVIREAITRGDFAPNQRLVEAELSEQFDASRAAVRNALVQLTTEGLVERIQHRGARVRAVSLAEAIEITEVRMVVEGLCAARAAERAADEDKTELREIGEQMRAAVAGGDVWGYSELNKRLHSLVLRVSGQRTAHEVLSRLRGQNVRHQFRLAMHPGRPGVSLPQHLAIIEAICAADPAAAERAMREHLGSVIDALPEVDKTRSSAV